MLKNRFNLASAFFIVLMVCGSVMLFYQLFVQTGNVFGDYDKTNKGGMDLSEDKSIDHHVVRVVCEAEFYWLKLLTPSDFDSINMPKSDGFLHMPGVWNDFQYRGQAIGGMGYGTYRFVLKVPRDGRYALKLKEIDCAYRIWANDAYAEVGTVGTTKSQTIPCWQRKELYFDSTDGLVEVVMQVANFHHRKGGAEDIILFGQSQQISSISKQNQAISYFLSGVFFIMCLHFFIQFLFRKGDKSVLYFSLLTFAILLRMVTTGEKILLDVYPSMSWIVAIHIEYLAYMIVVPLFIGFTYHLFPEVFSSKILRWAWYVYAFFVLLVLMLPPRWFTYTPLVYQMFFVMAALYNLWGLLKCILKRKHDAIILFAAYIIIFIIFINDILYYNRVIGSEFLLPTGLLVLVFSQSFVLSRRSASAFGHIEVLSHQLETHNLELEDIVQLRTKEIEFQRSEIANQALALQLSNKRLKELDALKEQMVQMLVHDLKNPLNTIISIARLKDFPEKDEMVEVAGKQMLQMVMNLLDVNKFEQVMLVPKKAMVDINQLIDKAIYEVDYLAKQKNLKWERNSLELLIEVEEELMLRVLVNILGNAIKFSPVNGTIFIQIHQRNAKWVIISMRDQGPGIRPEVRRVIFDRYVSNSQNTSMVARSTGLGLAFCKLVVEAHGGCVGVSDVVNEGSEFYVELPL